LHSWHVLKKTDSRLAVSGKEGEFQIILGRLKSPTTTKGKSAEQTEEITEQIFLTRSKHKDDVPVIGE